MEDYGVANGGLSDHAKALERGLAINAQGGALRSRLSNLMGLALLALLCVGFMSWYYSRASGRRAASPLRSAPVPVKGDFVLPPLQIPKPTTPIQPASPTRSIISETAYAVGNVLDGLGGSGGGNSYLLPNASAVAVPGGSARAADNKSPLQLARERRLSDALWVPASTPASAGTAALARSPAAQESVPLTSVSSGGTRQDENSRNVAELLRPSVVATAHALVLPTQRLLLPKGAFIDCTLETAIDSTLPGLTTCITPVDTYSADGTVVLLERGTKLIGETRGEVQQGSARVFVLWTEARTPLGVVVPLASPGTDELGRSGLPGDANHHFFERFGAAILVSVIDGAIQAAANSRSQGTSGSTIVMNPSGSQDVLTEVLRNTISVPPSISKPQGDRIQILVARDLDFRSVYQLHPH
jgi:type IV secretion system protein VirB10